MKVDIKLVLSRAYIVLASIMFKNKKRPGPRPKSHNSGSEKRKEREERDERKAKLTKLDICLQHSSLPR